MKSFNILLIIALISVILFLVMIIFYILIRKSSEDIKIYKGQNNRKTRMNNCYQKFYIRLVNSFLFGYYIRNIRLRLEMVNKHDEWSIRKKTVQIAIFVTSISIIIFSIIIIVNRSIYFMLLSFFAVFVVNDILIDIYVSKLDTKLLKQQVKFLGEVRHSYYQHAMVDEAIYDAFGTSDVEIAMQGEIIYEILTGADPENELESYYDLAPNKYLKLFAGLSFITKEYGDQKINGQSLFIKNINYLIEETNMELLKREKLDYMFRNLSLITLVPLLTLSPIENWARKYFVPFNRFYDSTLGFLIKVLLFFIIFISYFLVRRLHGNHKEIRSNNNYKYEGKIIQLAFIKRVVYLFMPTRSSKKYQKTMKFLTDSNAKITIEGLYLRRFMLSVFALLFCIITISNVLSIERQNIYHAVGQDISSIRQSSDEKKDDIEMINSFDKNYMSENPELLTYDEILADLELHSDMNDETRDETARRISWKIERLNNVYVKWWQVMLTIFIIIIAYYIPCWGLHFQRHINDIEKQNEVMEYQTIIIMLMQIDRMSVETILEWMEQFSYYFKAPIEKCLNQYEMGAYEALEELREEVTFPPFTRIIDSLQIAAEKIPIRDAFDELESDRHFYYERRKYENDKLIDKKVSWGQLVGFLPVYAVIFLYLVIPFIIISLQQMESYNNLLQGNM